MLAAALLEAEGGTGSASVGFSMLQRWSADRKSTAVQIPGNSGHLTEAAVAENETRYRDRAGDCSGNSHFTRPFLFSTRLSVPSMERTREEEAAMAAGRGGTSVYNQKEKKKNSSPI